MPSAKVTEIDNEATRDASAGQSETVTSTPITLEGLAAIVQGLAATVQELAARPVPSASQRNPNIPDQIPRARSTKEILEGMRVGDTRVGQDRIDPSGQRLPFKPYDIIELTHPDKIRALRENGKATPGEPVYGVVQSFMYRRKRDGRGKFRVDFGPGRGDDGLMEDEMALVKSA